MRASPAILNDLRVAIKSLARTPLFTVIAIVTLGLGIGANTSMFSVLSGYMLRPPPYPESDQLDRIYRGTAGDADGGVSPADFLELRREATGYGEVAGYSVAEMNLSEAGRPAELVRGARVSANLFSLLREGPWLGRGFRADETVHGSHRVLIVSHRLWQHRFGGDAGVLGRPLRVDGEVYRVVGVLPEDFSDWRHLGNYDLFQPLAFDAQARADRASTAIHLVGRRSAARTPPQGDALVAAFGRRLAQRHPAVHAGASWHAVPIGETFLPWYGQAVIAMLVALSGFVLLIACSNLANLLLVRTIARAREFAVRSALGASRFQVLRPLFLESLLLALLGGACAILVALWAFDWMEAASVGDSGYGFDLHLDWRVLSWALGACLFTALAFGTAPALFALRVDPNRILRGGARGNSGGRGLRRFRGVLIVGQFALAMVLLAGAALFVRGLDELNNRRYGWESDQVVTGTVLLPDSRYPGDREVADFQRLALERLEALPGVKSASLSFTMPYFGLGEARKYQVAGRPAPRPGEEPGAVINGVTPGYFETVGTRVLAGRAFRPADGPGTRVFIINQSMAEALFPGESALGRRIARAGEPAGWGEVVDVVADVQSVLPEKRAVPNQLYQPLAQEPRRAVEIALRAEGVAPARLVESVRTTFMALDPDLPVRRLRPARVAIARANYGMGVLSRILTALGLLGLGLAALGIYGVIARSVAQRADEFGIRLALGAVAGDITRLVLASGARLALVGSVLGLVGALGVSRLIMTAFPNMRTNSLLAVIGVNLLLVATALLACYLPARRVARISPAEALQTM